MTGRFSFEKLRDFSFSCSLEWLETNGLGGYAAGTVSGANTRRYHGLLVAALNPPVERRVVLSRLEETIAGGDTRYDLSSNVYPGVVHPQGYTHLTSFERSLFPVWTFEAGGIRLEKTIACIHGENTTVILYKVEEALHPFQLELSPLCSFKDFHHNARANDSIFRGFLFDVGVFRTKNYQDSCELFISVPGSQFVPTGVWYYNFQYPEELERGLDFTEDLYNHGRFVVEMRKGTRLAVVISTEDCTGRDGLKLFNSEQKRRKSIAATFDDKNLKRLALAADQFIARRGHDGLTVIAGYPWFTDWGRDTMIALPGICLTTGRHDDARKILLSFATFVSQGMIPNRFPDAGTEPEYNTVDATLWFFVAIYRYYNHTDDKAFIRQIMPVLESIIEWHYKGTRYNIHVDTDELLYAGTEGVQLTWMDVKIGDWVVTPRKGKTVEINALWYNAIEIMKVFFFALSDNTNAELFGRRAEKARASFNNIFWDDENRRLYDYVDGDQRNTDLRPNQLYAAGLPFSPLSSQRAEVVVDSVKEKLLTSWGLRTLAPDHPSYRTHYRGNPYERDASYHQGTVWSHLLGIYIDALLRVKGDVAKPEARSILLTFFNHLDEKCVGSISEIFDAELPHHPRGCVAQAWSVGEILRVAVEHDLVGSSVEQVSSAAAG